MKASPEIDLERMGIEPTMDGLGDSMSSLRYLQESLDESIFRADIIW